MKIMASALLLVSTLYLTLAAATQTPTTPPTATHPAAAGALTFATPQAAADALITAAAASDSQALEKIFGPDGHDLVVSGDDVQDKMRMEEFTAKANERHVIEVDKTNSNLATLSVGADDWPFPVPIERRSGRWSFDIAKGRTEILHRRVGANELDAIEVCRGFVEAQHQYAYLKRDGYGVNEYAQRIISTPGTQDGLAWQNPDGTWAGPVGETIAQAIQQGYTDRAQPYHGYFFKVLTGQGPAAPLGEMDFVIKGAMIGGFALAAAPATYAVTGVQTFIVSHDGIVYQKDFGTRTLDAFKAMDRYNPDKTWTPVEDQ